MTFSRLGGRAALQAAALTLGVLPLVLATPAFADSHSVSLAVGPLPVPHVPVTACIDTTCVTTPPLTSVTLAATATVTSGPLPVVLLLPASCPNGGSGVEISVSSLQPVTVTVSGSLSGTTTSGPISIPLGPVTQTVGPGTPGLLVSACTD
ncbi:hypothetical protein [Kitasatospora azatica]|uniref:hypothetical protein n=1 Tax=Kitasatospora azatica TaxID=58347 RepID=UPI00055F3F17|nr:hypothetical protein [Kitasatospora azatica]